jgi:hypothetical protein
MPRFYNQWLAGQDRLPDEKFENINSMQQSDLLIDSTKYSGTLVIVRDAKQIPFARKRLVV